MTKLKSRDFRWFGQGYIEMAELRFKFMSICRVHTLKQHIVLHKSIIEYYIMVFLKINLYCQNTHISVRFIKIELLEVFQNGGRIDRSALCLLMEHIEGTTKLNNIHPELEN